MDTKDLTNPIEVVKNIYWVGVSENRSVLHCNPYLLVSEDEAILFDPGSIRHFPVVMRKVMEIIDPGIISALVVHHQDPDVCGSLAVVEEVINRDDLKIIAHTNTIRLLEHYGFKSSYYPVEKNGYSYVMKSGRKLEFIFTRFLHSPGAIATYDPKTGTLFTSDLFGAVFENWSIFPSEGLWDGMAVWHRTYMPSNSILKSCLENLRKLDINRILPQHGCILEGENIAKAFDLLMELKCGIDLD
ncbi:MAG: FprA family A-type flavoprotein [Nitrospinota bacterium]|nr:FprA family A-type flavoprotein [Nitrospinota bacterium]